jgi:exosortase
MSAASRLWALLALALFVTLIYWPSPAVYWVEWSDFRNITFTHGWLIVAVCVALVLRSRRDIAAASARPSALALLALAGCTLAWLVCYRACIQDLHIAIFPAIFWLAVAGAFGLRMGVLLAFPVAFFYFAVPSWAQLGPPLQDLTVRAMRGLFWLTGPEVGISGDLIRIPNGSFLIEEGCSGLHFMIVGLAIAALHGELRRDSWKVRSIQLALMVAFALLANWVRVYTIIEAGYLTDMRSYLVSVSHYWFGWGVFAGALALFFWLTALLPATVGEGPPTESATSQSVPVGPRAELGGVAAALLVLLALPTLSWGLRIVQQPPPALSVPLADTSASWSSAPSDTNSSWQPTFPGADQQQRFTYKYGPHDTVEVFRVAFRTQRQGAKLIGTGTTLIGDRLKLRHEDIVDTTAGAFREALATDRSGGRWLIWSRYHTAGRDFVAPVKAQLWYGIKATVANPPASLTAYRAACATGAACEDARRVLREFAVSGVIS